MLSLLTLTVAEVLAYIINTLESQVENLGISQESSLNFIKENNLWFNFKCIYIYFFLENMLSKYMYIEIYRPPLYNIRSEYNKIGVEIITWDADTNLTSL